MLQVFYRVKWQERNENDDVFRKTPPVLQLLLILWMTSLIHIAVGGNWPVVENISSVILDNSRIPVIPVESDFRVNPVYAYHSSIQVQMVLQQIGVRYMEIDDDKATYVLPTKTVTLSRYQLINGDDDDGLPVSISTPESMCIKGNDVGPLSVVAFPSYMTRRGIEIPLNSMFFILSFLGNGAAIFKAANALEELYISYDEQIDGILVASLRTSPSKFRIESGGNVLKTREDFLKLFKTRDS